MLAFLRRWFYARYSCPFNGHRILCTVQRVEGTAITNHSHVCTRCGFTDFDETELGEDTYQRSLLARTYVGSNDLLN